MDEEINVEITKSNDKVNHIKKSNTTSTDPKTIFQQNKIDSNLNCDITDDLLVVVDNNQAKKLVEIIITKTKNYSIENLTNVKSKVHNIIFKHRLEINKATLLQDLEKLIKETIS